MLTSQCGTLTSWTPNKNIDLPNSSATGKIWHTVNF